MASCLAPFYLLASAAAFFGLDPANLRGASQGGVSSVQVREAPDASAWDGLRQILQQWQFTTEYAVVVGDVTLVEADTKPHDVTAQRGCNQDTRYRASGELP